MNWLKSMFRKPSPLEKAARELAQLEHMTLETTAEIAWAEHRLHYQQERAVYLRNYIQERAV